MRKFIILMLPCFILMACTHHLFLKDDISKRVKKTAQKLLGENEIQYIKNAQEDYILCVYSDSSAVPSPKVVKVLVLESNSAQATFQTVINGGSAKWVEPYMIELFFPPGVIKDSGEGAETYYYKVDVRTGEKVNTKATLAY